MPIRPLTQLDGEQYRLLRLTALQTNPQAFLASFEQEVSKSAASFGRELELTQQEPIFGYYGLFASPLNPAAEHSNHTLATTLVGFVQLGSAYFAKQQHIAYLYNLYVAPEARNQGNASLLLTYVLRKLQELPQLGYPAIHRLYADVVQSNIVALSFYSKHGYTQCGLRQDAVKTSTGYDSIVELELRLHP